VATALIERNTTIPARKTQVFSTAADNQDEVEINVVQGERSMAADNKSLGKFRLDGIPAAARGVPQIDVTFDIDADGILKVGATDQATGRSQHITITASSGLTEEEVEQMTGDAELHASHDVERKKRAEARNAADNTIYNARKAMERHQRNISESTRVALQEMIQELELALDEADTDSLETLTLNLSTAVKEAIVRARDATAEHAGGSQDRTNAVDEEITEA
jgi:molecular chaperone DnaK